MTFSHKQLLWCIFMPNVAFNRIFDVKCHFSCVTWEILSWRVSLTIIGIGIRVYWFLISYLPSLDFTFLTRCKRIDLVL